MPSKRYNRQVALLEPSVEKKLLNVLDQKNIAVAKFLRMTIKYLLSNKDLIQEVVDFGDPKPSKE